MYYNNVEIYMSILRHSLPAANPRIAVPPFKTIV